MRKTWMMALALCLLLASLMGPGANDAKAAGPSASWTFDEGSGTSAGDASGGGLTGTLQGDAGWATGLVGAHALNLPGAGQGCVDVPKPAVDTTHSYTVMAWVKVNQVEGYQTFVSIDGDQVSGFFLQLRGDTGRFGFAVLPADDSGNNQPALASAADSPQPNVWYHLAGVYDSTAHTITLYVNGKAQGTAPLAAPWRAGGHTLIGRGKYGAAPTDFVAGQVDDVRFTQAALPPADVERIAQPYLQATPPPQPALLEIHPDQPGARVSPTFYGLMTEEINHSYDGGLYGELIQNRAFKDDPNGPAHWSLVQDGGGSGVMALDTTNSLNAALDTSLKLTVTAASKSQRVGVANDGYWGIPVTRDTRYRASFYARAADGFQGPLTAAIESTDGKTVFARAYVPRVTGVWRQYTLTMTTGPVTPSEATRFVLTAAAPGTVWLNLVSLFPPTFHNRPNGNRIDLMEKMAAMKPSFLRLPGGNYLEGDTIATRFDWKKTVGPVEQRPGHQGPWRYRSSDGLGLLEFLEWCEDLRMQPVLAVFAGYALRHEHVDAGPPLQPFVQDALDEIEYVTGDAKTRWGAERAKDGHPAPFPLTYVEIGNEDWLDGSHSYDGRYAQFSDAIKAAYPRLQLIATTGVKSRTPDVIDDHYYKSPGAFERDVHHYDGYSRTGPKIFVGEWAAQEGKPTPDMNAALGDAAWMTGMERNSDLIVLESYAPLLVNVNPGGKQWGTNLIGYDALSSYGSPSYYAQAMFGGAHGDVIVPATLTGGPGIFESITRDSKTGLVYAKMVNVAGVAQPVHVTLSGVSQAAPTGTATVLSSASPSDTNTLTEPTKIVPVATKVSGLGKAFDYPLPPYSITVLQWQAK